MGIFFRKKKVFKKICDGTGFTVVYLRVAMRQIKSVYLKCEHGSVTNQILNKQESLFLFKISDNFLLPGVQALK